MIKSFSCKALIPCLTLALFFFFYQLFKYENVSDFIYFSYCCKNHLFRHIKKEHTVVQMLNKTFKRITLSKSFILVPDESNKT